MGPSYKVLQIQVKQCLYLLLEGLHPTTIKKESEGDRFQFSRLTTSIVVLYEEPMITQTNVNLCKSILGGGRMETDLKNESHQTKPILPLLITTNQDITHNREDMDANARNSRIL